MYYTLKNGIKIPKIGFGTWQISNDDVYEAVLNAIKIGYRHIDTAYNYHNEEGISRAIIDSGVKREDLFITTKLPDFIKNYDETIKYFYDSLNALKLDYVDLYLIHAPWPWSNVGQDCKEGNIEAWKAMIDLYNKGLIKSIGVSNFNINDLDAIIKATNFVPHVNQIRFFIGNTQETLTKYCEDNGILVEAYSPFATGNILNDEKIVEIANKYNTTVSSIALKYILQRGALPLPKSTNIDRQKQNLYLADYVISDEDMEILNKIHNPKLDRPLRS